MLYALLTEVFNDFTCFKSCFEIYVFLFLRDTSSQLVSYTCIYKRFFILCLIIHVTWQIWPKKIFISACLKYISITNISRLLFILCQFKASQKSICIFEQSQNGYCLQTQVKSQEIQELESRKRGGVTSCYVLLYIYQANETVYTWLHILLL